MTRFLKYFVYLFFFVCIGILFFSMNVYAVKWEDLNPDQKEVAFCAAGMRAKTTRQISEAISGATSPCAEGDIRGPDDIEASLKGRREELIQVVCNARFLPAEQERILRTQLSRFDETLERFRNIVFPVWADPEIKAAVFGLRALFKVHMCPVDDSPGEYQRLIQALSPLAAAYEIFKREMEEVQSVDGWVLRKQIFPDLDIPGKQESLRPSLNPNILQQFKRFTGLVADALDLAQQSAVRGKRERTGDEGVMDLGRTARINFQYVAELLPPLLHHHGMTLPTPQTLLNERSAVEWFLKLKRESQLSLDGYETGIRGGLRTFASHSYPFESAGNRVPSAEFYTALTILHDISGRYGVSAVASHLLAVFMDIYEQDGKCATGALGRAFLTFYHGISFLMEMPTKVRFC